MPGSEGWSPSQDAVMRSIKGVSCHRSESEPVEGEPPRERVGPGALKCSTGAVVQVVQ